jgi:leader peptidase (prepilin peptidase) / N-methyltransferase
MTAGVIGSGFFLLHYFSKGRAMGLGDSPVALALALVTGGSLAIAGLLFSFWIGAVVGIGILVATPKGHRMGIEVPFVPFLAAGYLLAYFTQWNPLLLTL